MDEIAKLLSLPIIWQKSSPVSWVAKIDGVECEIRMNDFPDEPLYTLSFQGQSLDIDDVPTKWKIPHD